MTQLRKDILLQGDPNRVWAVARDFAGPAEAGEAPPFRFEEGHVSAGHAVIIDDDQRRLTYVLPGTAPAEGNLQVQGSAGGMCRLVWVLEGDDLPADLDARMSAMADAMFAAVAGLGGGEPPHPALPRWSFPGTPNKA